MDLAKYRYTGEKKFRNKDFDTSAKHLTTDKEQTLEASRTNILKLDVLQDRLYADSKESLLIVLQAMDAGGKDGIIKHVMSGMNPQGVEVTGFKQPSKVALSHDYLWRYVQFLPAKGKIGIFNRSYYEDVLVSKVHRLYENQAMPDRCKSGDVIAQRYKEIANLEKQLWNNGTRVLKFFLNISKDEQKKRFISRIEEKRKNWKLSEADIQERQHWDEYMLAFEGAVNNTSAPHAPWFVVPADKKWFARYFVSQVVSDTLEEMDPKYPKVDKEKAKVIRTCKEILKAEK